MAAEEPIVIVQDLAVRYGDRQVLDQMSLRVSAGEVYALLGGNGAGKSTTLQALLGFLRPTSGLVRVAGCDPAAEPEKVRRSVAYIPENVALYEHLSARENVDYFLDLARATRVRPEVDQAFHAVGLPKDAWERRVLGFSKGMRQKTAIALAMLRQAKVFLLDEPTSGLDPGAAADFNRLLANLRAERAAVLVVTHDLVGAADVADRIGFLEQGRIVQEMAASGPERFDLRALHNRFQRAQAA
jgi:ABC-2 type transport system ATP-binding protein